MDNLNQKIYEKAIKLLSIRQHTTGELFRKLKAKGFENAGILAVLKTLEDQKFLNDQKFSEIFVDNLKRYKDWGYYAIKGKLLKYHIPNEIAESALSEYYTIEEEMIVAERFIEKLKKQRKIMSWEQLAGKLQTKGFRNEVTRKVVTSTSLEDA